MTGGVRVVGVAADAASGGDPTAPVQAALLAAGVPVEGRVLVDDDEAALERALGVEAPLAVAFVLFRVFDIVKPAPARQAQALPGGTGVMVDDLIAGLYALVVIAALRRLVGWP